MYVQKVEQWRSIYIDLTFNNNDIWFPGDPPSQPFFQYYYTSHKSHICTDSEVQCMLQMQSLLYVPYEIKNWI
jgi:hypothetical protein